MFQMLNFFLYFIILIILLIYFITARYYITEIRKMKGKHTWTLISILMIKSRIFLNANNADVNI